MMESVQTPPVPELDEPFRSEERIDIQTEARRFAAEEILPVADQLDPRKEEIPRDLLDKVAKQGYFGITVPRDHGGMGLGVFEYCMISEELARAWMSVASIIVRAQGAMGVNVADQDRRRTLIEKSARGEWIGAAALSEPDVGSDLAGVQTRALRDGDDYVITGSKRWCGNALAADFIQVFCRLEDTKPGQSRAAGLGSILIEKDRGEFPPGLTGSPIDKIGYHGFLTWNLEFDGLRVPVANRVFPKPAGDSTPLTETAAASTAGFKAVEAELNTARCKLRPAQWDSLAVRSKIALSTCKNGSSSGGRLVTFSICASPWPKWPHRSSRLAPSTSVWPTRLMQASRACVKLRW